ncbi:rRNA maturation RNase YbeY [Polynucleobacter sp. MWH-HuK1]|uniref:rRNA maturation RNase YbeY n=1 Tax=Polynucleobacter sp. MWH-HuK1 TaxID=1743158 RepID=UPI001C0DDE22|nr:rRNA maturation RNase YbeY [Polynucleobacter sp. MWH-HuK1]MBU3565039.1 rRNA maturation RNase YbeY [Polynucleobacter sp. MWH-HuK1]
MSTKNKVNSPKLKIDLQYASSAIESTLNKIASPALIKKWVKSATPLGGFITLRFVNAAEGKKLNLAFRQKDYATNVLTFPYELSKNALAADIIFCLPILQKEAKEQDKLLKAHLAHLVVHGCLHAQGYDHEVVKEARKMETLEIQTLQKMGFDNPYQ